MRLALGCLALAYWLAFAANSAFSAAPTQSCKQTQAQCVADRVATGSKPVNAQARCAEILAKCKKK